MRLPVPSPRAATRLGGLLVLIAGALPRLALASPMGSPLETMPVVILARPGAQLDGALAGVGGHVRGVVRGRLSVITASLPRRALGRVAALPGVVSVVPAGQEHPTLDISVPETRANLVWNYALRGTPLRGAGVLVAVVDSGIDWHSADFQTTDGHTRIRAIWDQTSAGTPPAGFSYGALCTSAAIDAGACAERDTLGHGTHVASIAAANGNGARGHYGAPRYIGMAPRADLIVVKSTLRDGDVIDAWSWIVATARLLHEPVVINGSFGTQEGAHDGTAPLEQAIDSLAGPGVLFVQSAGNDGDSAIHARAPLDQQDTHIGFSVTAGVGGAYPQSRVDVNVWYPERDSLEVSLRHLETGETFGPLGEGAPVAVMASDGQTQVMMDARRGASGDHNALIHVARADGGPIAGRWVLDLHPTQGVAGDRIDAWLTQGGDGQTAQFFTDHVDPAGSVTVPGTAHRALTVGAYMVRTSWMSRSAGGETVESTLDGAGAPGTLAAFSSRGGTRDGRPKPDLVAPGGAIMATLSRDSTAPDATIDPDLAHRVDQGTSMAAPHVTGALALLLQVDPAMTPEQATAILRRTARVDSFVTATVQSATGGWGAGKLDALAALTATETLVGVAPTAAAGAPGGVAVSRPAPALAAARSTRPPAVTAAPATRQHLAPRPTPPARRR